MPLSDVIIAGTFSSGGDEAKQRARQLVQLGEITVNEGLAIASSDDREIVWSVLRPHVLAVIKVQMFGYVVPAFVLDHQPCMKACADGYQTFSNAMHIIRYWVYNVPAGSKCNTPWISLSSEIGEKYRTYPILHEAFENAIVLGGVKIDGEIVPETGRCQIASRLEISRVLEELSPSEVVEYLRTREQMFANAGETHEFSCSLALFQQVLQILDP